MCIIAYKPAGKPMFPVEQLRNMFRKNPHGAGIAYIRDGKVFMAKGFMEEKSFISAVEAIKDPLNTDIVVHCRIATSGGTTRLNCHPYPLWKQNTSLGGTYEAVMFHNGILDSYGYKGEKEGENDTQAFIRKCLKKLPHSFLKNEAILEMIHKTIGTNRLVFVSKYGVKMVGNFIEDNGYYYSNASYKPVEKPKEVKPKYYGDYQSTLFPELDRSLNKGKMIVRKYPDEKAFRKAVKELAEKANLVCLQCWDFDYDYDVDFRGREICATIPDYL